MGLCRRCLIDSKAFELAVEGNSSGVRILESCRGFVHSVFLGRADCRWLLATEEELLQERGSKVFWRHPKLTSLLFSPNDAQTSTGGLWYEGAQWR